MDINARDNRKRQTIMDKQTLVYKTPDEEHREREKKSHLNKES